MPPRRIGILHPGQMGSVVAASALNSGNQVWWSSEGRSKHTAERAAELRLHDAGSLAALCETCPVIVSVCPPEFADDTADSVLRHSFRGLYIDANAISPERVRRMDARMRAAGVRFVDAGIIGPAVRTAGKTWIYLSGEGAVDAAACFAGGPIQPEPLDGGVGQASALKMCYAAYSKGATALLAAAVAAAERLGVREALEQQWQRSTAGSPDVVKSLTMAAPRAWRWAPEMREIAATFQAVGLPPEFHEAAAGIYTMLGGFKDTQPQFEEILRALTQAAAAGESR